MSNNNKKRASWRDYFLSIAEVVGTRATCPGASVGVVIVDPQTNRILSTGYNGSAPGDQHCTDVKCLKSPEINDNHCRRVIHAETNAIGHAARYGTALKGAHMYTSFSRGLAIGYALPRRYDGPLSDFPCLKCGQLMQATGIKEAYLKEGLNIVRFYNEAS